MTSERVYRSVFLGFIGCLLLFLMASCDNPSSKSREETYKVIYVDSTLTRVMDYREIPFPDTPEGEMAAYGKELMVNTYKYFFDEKGNKVGNRLSCTNCHLNLGTKPYSAPFVGLSGIFPMYRGRSDQLGTLEDRINGCFERSMNGRPIAEDSKEMLAMVSYIKHLSKGVKIGSRIEGQGFVEFTPPNRAADPVNGKKIFQNQCAVCHQKNGRGLPNNEGGYTYPPLWGPDSYNDGAGMNRILTAAAFIKGNMPYGTVWDEPQLSDEEAYDVAAYIDTQDRPVKSHKERDYPDLSKKPKDAAFPPFNDTLSLKRHKYGPFNF